MQLTLPGGRVISGIDAYRRMVEQSFAWAAPVSFDVHALAVDEENCAGGLDDPRPPRARTTSSSSGRGLSICELRDGRITWWREHHLAPPAPVD